MTDVKIIRQKRRSMMMRPVPGGFEVYIPHWMKPSSTEVKRFIQQGLDKLEAHQLPIPAEQTSRAEVLAMVDAWAKQVEVQAERVQFRDMRRKWGSCSGRKTITFNRALLWVPRHLAEYVVLHELVHLREFNHGKGFQALMSAHMPDWREREAELYQVNFWKS